LQDLRLGDIGQILVLNRNHIGDCLLTTPMLRSLKRRFPRAHMAVAVPASNQDLLVTNPHVDEIMIRPQVSSWGGKFGFACQIRDRGYDLIISLQEKSLFYSWATYFTTVGMPRKPITVALDHARTRRFYQYNVRPMREDQHEVYKYLDVASLLGCPRERNPVLELEPTASSRERVERLLSSQGFDSDARFIGINPGGTKPDKRWPVERFAEVADRLREEMGLPVIIFGGPCDRPLAEGIVAGMNHQPLVVAGQTSLGDTAALMERCQLLVTGDTGPMHMAVALAVPVVAMFGPTNPVKFGPFSTLRTILSHAEPCPRCTQRCVHTITAEECVSAALKLYMAPPVPRVRTDHH
jgi:lipopolysaccharide heptosyltransferase II